MQEVKESARVTYTLQTGKEKRKEGGHRCVCMCLPPLCVYIGGRKERGEERGEEKREEKRRERHAVLYTSYVNKREV